MELILLPKCVALQYFIISKLIVSNPKIHCLLPLLRYFPKVFLILIDFCWFLSHWQPFVVVVVQTTSIYSILVLASEPGRVLCWESGRPCLCAGLSVLIPRAALRKLGWLCRVIVGGWGGWRKGGMRVDRGGKDGGKWVSLWEAWRGVGGRDQTDWHRLDPTPCPQPAWPSPGPLD